MDKKILTWMFISFTGVFINNIISIDNLFTKGLNALALLISVTTLIHLFKSNKKTDIKTYGKPKRFRRYYYISAIIRLISLLLVLGFIIGSELSNYMNKQTYTITVSDTQVKHSGSSDNYLVFAKTNSGENIVFQNTDLLFIGKYNSSDIQAKLVKNKTFRISTLGYRVPFFSSYQNIVSADEIT